jgi:phage terminase small subunit
MPALLDVRYEIFAQNVARGKTLGEAHLIAGYKENAGNASTLASKEEVAKRINEIKEILSARSMVSAERVLAELARIGFSDITTAVSIKDGKVQVVDTDQLSPDMRAAISEIRETRDGIAVKLHDKRAALENLGKHLGLFKENIDLNVNVSLADLVNGSYKLEAGQPAAIEHDPDLSVGDTAADKP